MKTALATLILLVAVGMAAHADDFFSDYVENPWLVLRIYWDCSEDFTC